MEEIIQPTILIKKSDGTSERVTLAELKKRQAGVVVPETVVTPVVAPTPVAIPTTVVVPVSAPIVAPTPVAELVPVVTQIPSVILPEPIVSKPIENITQQQVATPLKVEDVKSLLHEETPNSEHAVSNLAASRTDQVSKVIDSLSFKVAAAVENRLKSIVQLRLKDIRGEADTLDACQRSIKDGGLGLTEPQAQELTKKAQPTAYAPKAEPHKKIEVVEKILQDAMPMAAIEDLINQAGSANKENKMPVRPLANTGTKMPIHDVKSRPAPVGPLQEIEIFSLTDFRRLSNNTVEAANRLKQKFLNLKEESYLLFMNSWTAWHQSPLYQSYISVVDTALSQRKPLSSVLGEKDKISLVEIEALINMEKELGI